MKSKKDTGGKHTPTYYQSPRAIALCAEYRALSFVAREVLHLAMLWHDDFDGDAPPKPVNGHIALPYRRLRNRLKLRDKITSAALRELLQSGLLVRTRAPAGRRGALYALPWLPVSHREGLDHVPDLLTLPPDAAVIPALRKDRESDDCPEWSIRAATFPLVAPPESKEQGKFAPTDSTAQSFFAPTESKEQSRLRLHTVVAQKPVAPTKKEEQNGQGLDVRVRGVAASAEADTGLTADEIAEAAALRASRPSRRPPPADSSEQTEPEALDPAALPWGRK